MPFRGRGRKVYHKSRESYQQNAFHRGRFARQQDPFPRDDVFSWQYLRGRQHPPFPWFTPITKIMFSKIVSTLDPITSISSDTRVSLANGNKLEEKAEHIHFKPIANTHILCQSQLFNAKHAYSEPISTETHIVWANHNYFKWNTYILSQLQLFQLKRA